MSRDRLIAIVVALVVGAGSLTLMVTQARDSDAVPAAVKDDADRFFETSVKGDGRVSRWDQGDDTVSEGQAYAMLIAVAVGDRERFDLVWAWSKSNLLQSNGLLAWRWQDGRVVDTNAATDADMDAARALALAAGKWRADQYASDAKALASAIAELEVFYDGAGAPLLVAGPWAATQVPVFINPSYHSPRAISDLMRVTGDARYPQLQVRQRQMISDLLNDEGNVRLPPDWATVDKSGVVTPSGAPADPGHTPVYSYDAFRTVVRLAESCDETDRQQAARLWSVLGKSDVTKGSVQLTLDGRPLNNNTSPLGYVAAAASAQAAGDESAAKKLLREAGNLEAKSGSYYCAAWVALGRIMLQTDLLGKCASPA